MINYDNLNNQLTKALQEGSDLNSLKAQWLSNLGKIDGFLEVFLDRYGKRLDPNGNNRAEWSLYNKKTEEYNNLKRAIKNVDYFIQKSVSNQ